MSAAGTLCQSRAMTQPVPTLDYTDTVVRPCWDELPAGVRHAVEDSAGARVEHAGAPARSGFSGGFAAVLRLADGRRVFAKAGLSVNPHLLTAYAQEALVLSALPPYGLRAEILGCFAALAAGDLALTSGQQDWVRERLPELQALVESSSQHLAGDTANHCDLRADNVLLNDGRALFVDWNWLCLGPPWTDFVGIPPLARADGVDVDAWLARSELTRGVDPEAVDAWLAAVAA